MTWSHRLPIAFLLCLFGALLVILVSVFFRRLGALDSYPPKQRQEKASTEEPGEISELPERVYEVTTQGFHSGGLGLERTSWEVLHGKPEPTSQDKVSYRQKTYNVIYQQGIVWQLERQWKSPGVPLDTARARVRRYLPLDSQYAGNVSTSTDLVVDLYQSATLTQQLALLTSALQQKEVRKTSSSAQQICVAVHRREKQYVTDTLVHIGEPRAAGYPPPPPQVTTTKKQSSVRKAPKAVKPRAKRQSRH